MRFDGNGIRHREIWAYGYWFVPPIALHRTGTMEALLDDGHAKARLAAHTWEGRLINGDGITHILVVSDTPDQDLEVNQLLEAELNRLDAPFAITAAIAIGRHSGLPGGALNRTPPPEA